jgi:hypothetical protein
LISPRAGIFSEQLVEAVTGELVDWDEEVLPVQ